MPHITVEYSPSLSEMMPTLLGQLHDALAENGVDKAKIKTRGILVQSAYVGEQGLKGTMMHATLLLLAGREVEIKKHYGSVLYQIMKQAAPADCSVTLEVREMAVETYFL